MRGARRAPRRRSAPAAPQPASSRTLPLLLAGVALLLCVQAITLLVTGPGVVGGDAGRGAAGGGVVPRRARAGVSVPPAPPAPLGRASRLGAVSREAVSLSHAAAVRALSMRPLPLDAPGEAFLVYQPRGGLAEQALALRSAIAAARALRRTLVLPHLRLPAADVPAPGLGSSTSGGRQRQADAAAPASGPSGSQLWSEVPFGAVFDVEAVRVAAGGRVVTLGDYLVAGGGAPERVMLVAPADSQLSQ